MTIILENKDTLTFDEFKFKCCIGKSGLAQKKTEGDKKTPKGIFSLGPLFFRKDKYKNIETKLKKIPILKNMAWCDDPLHQKYNKLVKINKILHYEKLFRNDYKYDLLIQINYNTKKTKTYLGSAIFLHLKQDFKP